MITPSSISRILDTVGTDPKRMFHGIYLASVVNTNDPSGKGRVTLKIPQVLGTAVSNWAVPLGFSPTSVPAPGTMVHAYFTGGDVNYPIYIYTGGIQSQINSLLPGPWISMSLQNSWVNTPSYISAQFRKTGGGDSVELIGNISTSFSFSTFDGTVVATLPSGFYNPSHYHFFGISAISGADSVSVLGTVDQGRLEDGSVSTGVLPAIPEGEHVFTGTVSGSICQIEFGPGVGQQFGPDNISSQSLNNIFLVNDQQSHTNIDYNTPSIFADTSGNLKVYNVSPFVTNIAFHTTIPLSA